MSLLNLVKEHDGIGSATDGFGQLSALVIADVAGRRPNQPRHRVLFHVFAHIDAHHGTLVVKQELRKCTRRLGLTDTGRAEEDKTSDRPLRI